MMLLEYKPLPFDSERVEQPICGFYTQGEGRNMCIGGLVRGEEFERWVGEPSTEDIDYHLFTDEESALEELEMLETERELCQIAWEEMFDVAE